ncbi:MAG: hypothetical protein VX951_14810 [Planctomycetota bacterium]|nr:hypothetical protein [Planctomycetota bacterium]
MHRIQLSSLVGLVLTASLAHSLSAQDNDFVTKDVLDKMSWRSLGPARFGGRVLDLAVHPNNPSIFWVASASGGLFKTTNRGINFTAQFQNESSISIGDVAVAPSNPDILYLGTGEANNQRSSYWGDGVYRSDDGGKNWQHRGLRGTDHIGRIVVHPTNPDVLYAAAAGALYSQNEERGVYRSSDGGKNWVKAKFISQDVGFIDIVMDPNDPKTLYAASYERRRRAWNFDATGPGSAIHKTTDGGDSWTKLAGGLPSGEIGRIGLDTFKGKQGTVVFAVVENGNPGKPQARNQRRRIPEPEQDEAEAVQGRSRASTIGGQVFRSANGGTKWTKISGETSIGGRPGYYYGQIRVDPTDEQRIYVLSVPVHMTTDGGKTWKSGVSGIHVDHHALWINPGNPRHLMLGNDGGLHISYDYGATWDHMNHLGISQFYAITVDMSRPYWIYGGTQDNGTWAIPSRATTSGGVQNRHAAKVNGGDGFFVQVDPLDPAIVYSESQFGRLSRQDLRTGERKSINPKAERGSPALRHNWSSPILLSSHNHHTVYFGSQYLHKSTNRGDEWQTISPDLSTSDAKRVQGNVPHCTITTIAESPMRSGLLWVGTDDGKVWVTKSGGRRWTDLTNRFDQLPAQLWVSRVEASAADADTAYVSFTGYREDIRDAFLFMTTDGGETFRNISNNLPHEPINVIREHPRNQHVLFVGTEFGVFVSLNGGGNWLPLDNKLPTVPCHDLMVHPRESDLIVGTHGRGIFVMDIAPLEDLSAEVLAKGFHVFPATDGYQLGRNFSRGWIGARTWSAESTDSNPTFSYYLRADSDETISLRVLDGSGKAVFTRARCENTAGLHRVSWSSGGGRGRGGRGAQFARMFGGRGGGSSSPAGQYVVELKHGKTAIRRVFEMRGQPPASAISSPGDDDKVLIK